MQSAMMPTSNVKNVHAQRNALSSDKENKKSIKVLYIEDDGDFRNLVKKLLKRDESCSYTIDFARNAGAAKLICASKKYDCILIDYFLPDAKGEEVVDDLKLVMGENTPPLIFLTASAEQKIALDVMRFCASDLLPKSRVSTASLSDTIQNAIKIQRSQAMFRQEYIQLKKANNELTEREKKIEDFYQSISVELKKPLIETLEFLSSVRNGMTLPHSNEDGKLHDQTFKSCDKIHTHVKEALDVIELGANKINLKRKLVSLESIILRSLASVASRAVSKNIEIIFEDAKDAPSKIYVDPDHIVQVISSLLQNAIKHSDSNSSVELKTRFDTGGKYLQIVVTDSGVGIDSKLLPHIFDRLYQIPKDSSSERFGLGQKLNIAKKIVKLHGGDIWAQSEHGAETTFTMHLPCNLPER